MKLYRIWYLVGGIEFSRIVAGNNKLEAIDRLHSKYTFNKAYNLRICFIKL